MLGAVQAILSHDVVSSDQIMRLLVAELLISPFAFPSPFFLPLPQTSTSVSFFSTPGETSSSSAVSQFKSG